MGAKKIHHPPETVALALREYMQTNGNARKAAEFAGVSHTAVLQWVKKGNWGDILENQRREVEAGIAADSLRQIVTIREMRINLHYRALAHIHDRVQAWQETPEAERGPFPFDPLKLAESMCKPDVGTGSDKVEIPKTEDALAPA